MIGLGGGSAPDATGVFAGGTLVQAAIQANMKS
jgi:hypothetical protein